MRLRFGLCGLQGFAPTQGLTRFGDDEVIVTLRLMGSRLFGPVRMGGSIPHSSRRGRDEWGTQGVVADEWGTEVL